MPTIQQLVRKVVKSSGQKVNQELWMHVLSVVEYVQGFIQLPLKTKLSFT
jgi:hypothetical protein